MHGFLIVILGSLFLAAQNVLLRVIFSASPIGGSLVWGGFITPTVGHSVLILAMRSLLILPAMGWLSWRLYPATGAVLRELRTPQQRALLLRILASSVLLFVSLAGLFTAIAMIPAGIATVLFFTHPVLTGLLSWKFFGNRPSRLRGLVTLGVLLGSVLVAPSLVGGGQHVGLGVSAAIVASLAYSGQGLLAQSCFQAINPIPFTLINFLVMAILSIVSLGFIDPQVPAEQWSILWIITAVAAVLTLLGQLFYNIGIHLVSAAAMAIVAVSNPMLTVMLAWIGLQETLSLRQWLGVAIVVISIVSLGRDRPAERAEVTPVNGE